MHSKFLMMLILTPFYQIGLVIRLVCYDARGHGSSHGWEETANQDQMQVSYYYQNKKYCINLRLYNSKMNKLYSIIFKTVLSRLLYYSLTME